MPEFKYYLMRRLATWIPTLIGVILITFIVSHVVPAMPAKNAFFHKVNPQVLEVLKKEFYLDKPLWEQFLLYTRDLLTGHWGTSMMTNRPVIQDLETYYPVTIQLAILGEILIIVQGIILGVIAAAKQNTAIDQAIRVIAIIGYSMPYFLLAIVLQYIFFYYTNLLPGFGLGKEPKCHITGLYLLDSLMCGDFSSFIDNLRHFILPAWTLSIPGMAVIARLMRGSLLDTLGSDFIDFCKMKGLPERIIVWKHAMKNALIPIVTVAALQFGGLLGVAVITETIFALPGVGRYSLQCTYALDFPSIMGVTFLMGLTFLIMNLIADLLYAFLDPRVRL